VYHQCCMRIIRCILMGVISRNLSCITLGSSQCTILSFRSASQLLVRSLLFAKLHLRYIAVILARLTTRRLYMLEKVSSATCASAPSSTSPLVVIPKSRYNFSPSSTSLLQVNHNPYLQDTHCGCSLLSLRCLATQLPPSGLLMGQHQ
jgi:hypothetical protein